MSAAQKKLVGEARELCSFPRDAVTKYHRLTGWLKNIAFTHAQTFYLTWTFKTFIFGQIISPPPPQKKRDFKFINHRIIEILWA